VAVPERRKTIKIPNTLSDAVHESRYCYRIVGETAGRFLMTGPPGYNQLLVH